MSAPGGAGGAAAGSRDAAGEARIRDFVPGRDEAATEALWERCFGAARGGQTLAWLFREGPAGPAPRAVAEVDGRVVAHAGVAPLRFRVEGREVRGGYSVGAMTDPGFQGRGLAVRTSQHLYERLAGLGWGLVAGFSNVQSHRLFTTRLGRTAIRPFPWAVHALRPWAAGRALLRGLAGGEARAPGDAEPGEAGPPEARARPVAPDDPRLDALWERAREEMAVGAVRDAAYARWRYATRPDAGYRAWLASRDGRPLAWAVGRVLPMRGLRAGFLLDLVVAPGEEAGGRAVVAAFEAWVRARGGEVANALRPGGGTARRVLDRARYLPVPERLHPQVIRFSVRGFGDLAGRPALADPRAWTLSWGDTDVV